MLLQTALDKESVVKATPFYRAATRQNEGEGFSTAERETDDARSVRSAGSRVLSAAKRFAAGDSGKTAILFKASLTSVLFELVRSDPWETVMLAGVSGLNASFSVHEGGVSLGSRYFDTLRSVLLCKTRGSKCHISSADSLMLTVALFIARVG